MVQCLLLLSAFTSTFYECVLYSPVENGQETGAMATRGLHGVQKEVTLQDFTAPLTKDTFKATTEAYSIG